MRAKSDFAAREDAETAAPARSKSRRVNEGMKGLRAQTFSSSDKRSTGRTNNICHNWRVKQLVIDHWPWHGWRFYWKPADHLRLQSFTKAQHRTWQRAGPMALGGGADVRLVESVPAAARSLRKAGGHSRGISIPGMRPDLLALLASRLGEG